MAGGRGSSVVSAMRTLFEQGTTAGMTDAQLLERFTCTRDDGSELAFAALVERHGPLVLGVCRRLLGQVQDAEDTFQATFLVLARRAGSIGKPDLLGPWLYGVAKKAAAKAKSRRARIRRIEERVMSHAKDNGTSPTDDPRQACEQADSNRTLLDELDRLAEPYRTAIVLCDLQGLTHAEASQRLGCAEGTVSARISRGRAMLRQRLSRKGISLGSLASGSTEVPLRIMEALAPSLARSTVCASIRFAHRESTAGIVSAAVSLLTGEVLATMSWTKLTLLAFAAVAGGSLAIGVGAATLKTHSNETMITSQQPKSPRENAANPGGDVPRAANRRDPFDPDPVGGTTISATDSIRKTKRLEAELRFRIIQLQRIEQLAKANAVDQRYAEEERQKVEILRGEVVDLEQSTQDEIAQIKTSIVIQDAKREIAIAQVRRSKEIVDILSEVKLETLDQKLRLADARGDFEIDSARIQLSNAERRALTDHCSRVESQHKLYKDMIKRFGSPGDPIKLPEKADGESTKAGVKDEAK